MTITIDLSDETLRAVRAAAERQGVGEADLLRTLVENTYRVHQTNGAAKDEQIAGALGSDAPPAPGETPTEGPTLYDQMKHLIGTINSSERNGGLPSRLSEDKNAFGDYVEQKHRRRHEAPR